MTDQQINQTIAEACGWRWEARMKGSIKVWNRPPNYVFHDDELPNYSHDLNAMHEAESRFKTSTEQMLYAAKILWVRGQGDLFEAGDLNVDHCWIAAKATARQRAEAFLRTIGKWEEQS